MSSLVQWKKYVFHGRVMGLNLYVGIHNVARVIKKGPKEYRWSPMGHGDRTGECETLREAKSEALSHALEYHSFIKKAIEDEYINMAAKRVLGFREDLVHEEQDVPVVPE